MESMANLASELEFDPKKHEYKLGGVVIPSVTQILREAGITPSYSEFGGEWYMERGRKVHEALHYDDEGDLLMGSLDPAIQGDVDAWRGFVGDHRVKVKWCEKPVLSRAYLYAGTLDRVLTMEETGSALVLADIKTGQEDDSTGVQLALYANAWFEQTGTPIVKRLAVHLHRDGTYKLVWYRDIVRDWEVGKAALTVAGWRRKHVRA